MKEEGFYRKPDGSIVFKAFKNMEEWRAAQDSTAPTPPVPVSKSMLLEMLIEELEADSEMKASMNEARKTVMLDGCTVTDLPAPPEVEPVTPVGDFVWRELMDWCKKMNRHPGDNNELFSIVSRVREEYSSPPYPADDELRKAAREFIDYFNAEYTNLTGPQIYGFLRAHNDKLSAALNKGKS